MAFLFFSLLALLPLASAEDTLSTAGYRSCLDNPTITITTLDATYDRRTRIIDFNVAGYSSVEQNVTATLTVTAYGRQAYSRTFDPCDFHTNMVQMCPIPAAPFSATGEQTVPEEYAKQIPSIAFNIPDLDGDVTLELRNPSTNEHVACITSDVGNGRSLKMPSVAYMAAGTAAAAFAASAVSAMALGMHPGGAAGTSPSFGDVLGWFQGVAMNGMLSVQYPKVYHAFTANFGFSVGLVPWDSMQNAIDNFRARTGGNLTHDSYEYLRKNATLVTTASARRALLFVRDTTISQNNTTTQLGNDDDDFPHHNTTANAVMRKEEHVVHGIQAYAEQLSIPQANTFMTLLLIWAILVAFLIVAILLLKVILEAWSMFGNIPRSMESWRKRYWWRLAKALTNLILLLYGIWTMYCIYQWTNGDSWAAKLLAGVSLALFTGVLLFFGIRIALVAREAQRRDGDASLLYEDKETWVKYSLFYENYRKGFWWVFVPAIIYTFARGVVVAAANGHGMVQSIGLIVIEGLFLLLLLCSRPYQRPSAGWINIVIHVVRVLSVVCVLVFVEELGISQTTKTVTGIALTVVQCVLTGVLAVLIAVNSIVGLIRENPHRKKRKELEKLNSRDPDDLTALDARNSLLMSPVAYFKRNSERFGRSKEQDGDRDALVPGAAGMGERDPSLPRFAEQQEIGRAF
ncbi:TRP-domain-containing protein [Piedraia hortae CBS 480.64]|uniref:TRP-domain-containing protein n=1 Tax=Piedraia hortae CBS 480.64 TaxID=1314780 RepID=A0A6A7BWB4_9PEZI|nr:TRP-domain-containing protein [Piedraia hortae CBS 480.64]